MSVLRVDNLVKVYPPMGKRDKKPFKAVNGISFALQKGEILGFLGPNGAGKTTTMHMLLGILTPSSGSIIYFDKDFQTHRSEIMYSVGFASAYARFPSHLSVYEVLDINARLYGIPNHERANRINETLRAFDAWELRNRQASMMSAGQTTKIMLVKAFLPKPKIVLLDEPTASLDPNVAQEARYFIMEQQKVHGTSVLYTSHNMQEVTELCDRVIVLQRGRIIASDTPKNLAESVASVRVELTVVDGLKRTVAYAEEKSLKYIEKERHITIEIDENDIAELLSELAKRGVSYSYVTVQKPTLEEYFMHIASIRDQEEGHD